MIRAETAGCPCLLQPGNHEWVTAIECINAMGWVLPPYIIFKGKSHIVTVQRFNTAWWLISTNAAIQANKEST